MKDNAYRKRVEQDLETWISQGLVPEESRALILTSLPRRGNGDGRGWLAMAATVLAGLAIITFVGDNWSAIPRGAKLILLVVLFLSAIMGAAFTRATSEKISNGLALLSTLIFAGSIALIGQAYNMPGAPTDALFASAFAASLIGLAGRSPAASFAALVFGAIWTGYLLEGLYIGWGNPVFWGLNIVAILVAVCAWRERSRALWHLLILSVVGISFFHILEIASLLTGHGFDYRDSFDNEGTMGGIVFSLMAALWTGLAWLGVRRDIMDLRGGRTLAGYGAWIALGNVALLGIPMSPDGDVVHRFLWLGLSIFGLWFGSTNRYGWISAASIVSLLTAISVIFIDLGMNLSSAALIFAISAGISLAVVVMLKRSANKEAQS